MNATPLLRALACAASLLAATAQAAPPPSWLETALEHHPDLQRARAEAEAAHAEAEAAGLPLYNPEVAVDVERGEVLTLSAGLNQTIDHSDRRGAQARAAQHRLQAAQAAVDETRLELAHRLLHLVARRQAVLEHLDIARQRVDLMARFVAISERRAASGDLDSTALATARLAENEARMRLAQVQAERAQVEQDLRVWFPGNDLGALPLRLPQVPPEAEAVAESGLEQRLPRLRVLAAVAQAESALVELRRRERRPNPTVGLVGGREGDAPLLGLNLSIPWQVRNPYRAEVSAAQAQADAARAAYQAALREALVRLRAHADRYRTLHQAWHHWLESGRASLGGQIDALERLWKVGELGTDAYLVRLGQTLDTRERVVSLRQDLWLAWFDLRYANGDLLERLPPLEGAAPQSR